VLVPPPKLKPPPLDAAGAAPNAGVLVPPPKLNPPPLDAAGAAPNAGVLVPPPKLKPPPLDAAGAAPNAGVADCCFLCVWFVCVGVAMITLSVAAAAARFARCIASTQKVAARAQQTRSVLSLLTCPPKLNAMLICVRRRFSARYN
jgi:hypothetical protein